MVGGGAAAGEGAGGVWGVAGYNLQHRCCDKLDGSTGNTYVFRG